MTITNKNLMTAVREMSNFMINNTQPPEDLIFKLVMEIRVSTLILPANLDDDGIDFAHIEAGGRRLIPLFSDNSELLKFSIEYVGVDNPFIYYRNMLDDLNFDGIVINPENEGFVIDKYLVEDIPDFTDTSQFEGYSPEKFREIAFDLQNERLLNFIRDDRNFRNYDGLKEIIYDSIFLSVVVPGSEVGEIPENGIITRQDVGGFSLLNKKSGLHDYCVLFSDVDAIEKAGFEYMQVCNLYETLKFVLNNDMDGIILNPDTDEYFIPRTVLLELMADDNLLDKNLSNAFDYAFILGE